VAEISEIVIVEPTETDFGTDAFSECPPKICVTEKDKTIIRATVPRKDKMTPAFEFFKCLPLHTFYF